MSAGPLIIEIICTCVLAAYLLHRYGDLRKQHVLVTLATFIAWYFSLMIIFILPLDVSLVSIDMCVWVCVCVYACSTIIKYNSLSYL